MDSRTSCPSCKFDFKTMKHEALRHISWQSKDLSDRTNFFRLGEKIRIKDGNLIFEASGNDNWTGCWSCLKCGKFFWSTIKIEDGKITEIKIKKDEEE